MSQDYNKDLDDGLKVMSDSSVHPIKKEEPGTAPRCGAGAARDGGASRTGAAGAARDSGTSRRSAAGTSRSGGTARRGTGAGGPPERPSQREIKEKARKKRCRRIIAMIIAECFALLFIFGYAYMIRLRNQMPMPEFDEKVVQNEDLDVETKERLKGYWTIAVFGVDARDNKTITKDTNSDVNIICNINLETGEIKLVSVFRDTYLNISKNGTYNKFNQAYFVGGPEQAVSALNRNLDLNITDYVTFNWKAVADAINILGGVDIELSKAEFYYINAFITETVKATGIGSHQLTHAGMNHLDGVQAVAYGRLRLMDTDYARTERQRKVIKQAFEKARQADFDTLNRALGAVFPQVATSIWVDDIFVNLKNVSKYHLSDTMGFPEARGDARIGSKGACVIPQTLETNVVKLHQFLFGADDYTPSASVQSISKEIAAESGMYKEGNYVKSVSTSGGIIQQPKTKASEEGDDQDNEEEEDEDKESTENGDEEDEEYEDIYVMNADGERVKKRVPRETDEDGDYIEQETDEDGLAVNWTLDESGKLRRIGGQGTGSGLRPTAVQTDEDGNPIETENVSGRRPGEAESRNPSQRPGGETEGEETRPSDPGQGESQSQRPTAPETGADGRPLQTEGNQGPSGSSQSSGSGRPGDGSAASQAAGSPGSTAPTAPGTSDTGSSQVPPGGSTAPTSPASPGAGTIMPSQGSGSAAEAPGGQGSPLSPAGGQGAGSSGPGSTGGQPVSGSPGPAAGGAPGPM